MEHVSHFLRNYFNYDRREASVESGHRNTMPSMTEQSHAEECDINTIVRRFGITGQVPVGVRQPEYGDFINAVDFQTAMNAIVAARESFDAMPALVRDRFHNDPHEFVVFVNDSRNREEATRLGLVQRPLEPVVAEVATTPSAGSPTSS